MRRAQTVVLVGAGHVHLYVASRAESLVRRGARVVLVDPDEFWYSGMATGMLGGLYDSAEDRVDPRPLIQAHGGEFIRDRVVGIDAAARRVVLAAGGELAYDFLSLNVGSRVRRGAVAGAEDEPTVRTVKPISHLWKLREELASRFAAEGKVSQSPRILVIGGGPTGAEVAANLIALARSRAAELQVTLAASGTRLIHGEPAGAGRSLERSLRQLGVRVMKNTRIVRREADAWVTESGNRIEADLAIMAGGLEADPLVSESGLPVRGRQGLRINAKLHSIADPRIFAGGDCAALEGHDLPKLGVYGVRQAACIHRNLAASLDGKPLGEYRPQKRRLMILNLGDGTALALWGPLWFSGSLAMRLKDRIDRRFLNRYRCEPPPGQPNR